MMDKDLRNALADRLRDWKYANNSLERTFEFPDFKLAMEFVNRIAQKAEEHGHHPDITINYNKVKLVFTTHDKGDVTAADTIGAGEANELASDLMHPSKLKTA
jgi:4a-hydroxytetrahydrobiopterin dehydratase